MGLTRLAVARPVTICMGLTSLLVLGAISLAGLPLDFLPHAEFPFIGVQVPYDNGVPGQVEREIARPVEEVLATLGGVREIFSQSNSGGVFVGVQFEWGRNVDVLRLEVKEKIDLIRPQLPADVRDIRLLTFDTNDIPVVEGRISARDRDLSESYDLIDRRVIQRLARVPGVGRVSVNGVQPPEVTVYLDLGRMKEHRVDGRTVFALLRDANFDLTVGQVEHDGLRYSVRAGAETADWTELAELPLNERGLRLGDVARVHHGTPTSSFGRFLNLEPAVAFEIQKSSGANTVEVVRRVREELDRINEDPALDGIDVLMFFDQGEQITHSLESLLASGLVGALLAIGVLYFFLRHLLTTLIVAMAIPVSILGTCTYLFLSGGSLNVLSMMGLMLGVGMLIDNAVVVLEAIHRRLQLGEPPLRATLEGSREVGRAVVSATLTSVVVFAPIVFGGGDELVVWLREVGITISITLLFSLVVSLTVIPVLTSRLRSGAAVHANPLVERWTRHYARILEWSAFRHPRLTSFVIVPAVIAVTVLAVAATGFGPETSHERGVRREYLELDLDYADDVDYRTSRTYVEAVQQRMWDLRESYGLRHVYSFYADDRGLVRLYFEQATLDAAFLARMRERVRADLPALAGVRYRLGGEDGAGSGAKSVSVTVHGEDTEELGRLAAEVQRRLELLPGFTDTRTDTGRGHREVHVHVDGERSRRLGVEPASVAEVMGITLRGVLLPRLRAADRELDLWVVLDEDDRRGIEDLNALTVAVQDDAEVTLDQVATTVQSRGTTEIRRIDQRTAVRVNASYEGENFDAALSEVRRTMDALALPAGYGWNFGSQIQRAREQQNQMGVNTLLALLCVYMIMASLFESLRHPGVVMSCVPFASLGVVWLMLATDTPLNIMAMIGIVILIGIVVNNGIVLVDHVNHYRRSGLHLDDALRRGAIERFRPILMTASTTVLGLVPLAVGQSHVGNGELYPMARALMGGLISSTALTLVLLPTYLRLGEHFAAWSSRRGATLRALMARPWSRRSGRGVPEPVAANSCTLRP
jgi:hydrophobic/amphiphilic exporter-1 (mainly G- bacteria), HAE1 family